MCFLILGLTVNTDIFHGTPPPHHMLGGYPISLFGSFRKLDFTNKSDHHQEWKKKEGEGERRTCLTIQDANYFIVYVR